MVWYYLEHQLAQHKRFRSETATTNASDLFNDNEEDKISPKRKFF